MPILTVGNCGEVLKDVASYRSPGCCSPSACMLAATAAMKVPFRCFPEKSLFRDLWPGRGKDGAEKNSPVSSRYLDRLPQPPCGSDLSGAEGFR